MTEYTLIYRSLQCVGQFSAASRFSAVTQFSELVQCSESVHWNELVLVQWVSSVNQFSAVSQFSESVQCSEVQCSGVYCTWTCGGGLRLNCSRARMIWYFVREWRLRWFNSLIWVRRDVNFSKTCEENRPERASRVKIISAAQWSPQTLFNPTITPHIPLTPSSFILTGRVFAALLWLCTFNLLGYFSDHLFYTNPNLPTTNTNTIKSSRCSYWLNVVCTCHRNINI